MEAGLAAIEQVSDQLASPKSRLKTHVPEDAATAALTKAGAARWVGFTLSESTQETYRQEHRGRPGAKTRYRRTQKPVFTLTAHFDPVAVAYDAVTDGCFPLITNDQRMTPAQVLAAYRYQPNLETTQPHVEGTPRSRPGLPREPAPHRSPAVCVTSWPCSSRPSLNARSGHR